MIAKLTAPFVGLLVLVCVSRCTSATPNTGALSPVVANANTSTPVAVQPNTPVQPNTIVSAPAADANHPATGPTERTVGRFDTSDPNVGAVFNWPGTQMVTRVMGTGVDVSLTPGDTLTYQGKAVTSIFDVFVDGQKANTFSLAPNITSYTAASNLTPGDHIVQVFKRTEPQMGSAAFLGFVATGNSTLLPAPLPLSRRIEFIGDSITAGYGADGNVATYAQCPNFTLATENAGSTFASITAANLGAEYYAVAWSGKGILQNDDCYGDPSNTLPELYDSAAPLRSSTPWDFTSWVPQAVVINLGTNDYNMNNGCPTPATADFTAAWVSFLKVVRGHYPDTYILCTVGPELHPPNLAKAQSAINTAVASLAASGDSRVAYVALPEDTGANGYGCAGHPNRATHQILATAVTQALKAALSW